MAIVVRHDQNGRAADALLQLLQLAQQQPQPTPEHDILQRIAPALAERVQPPRSSYASPPTPPVRESGHTTPRYIRPAARDASSDRMFDSLLEANMDQRRMDQQAALAQFNAQRRMDQQAALAQFNAQQIAQRQADDNARQLEQEQLQQAGMLARQFSDDVPQWISEGLSSGVLKYTPASEREYEELQNARTKLANDPSFSPVDKARMDAQLLEKIRQNRLRPVEVPVGERPVTPQQQFNQQQFNAQQQAEQDKFAREAVREELRSRQEAARLLRQLQYDAMSERRQLQRDIVRAKADLLRGKQASEPETDFSAMEQEIAEMEKMLESITVPQSLPAELSPTPSSPPVNVPSAGTVPPPQDGAVTVWTDAQLAQVLSDPAVPSGTLIVWGPDGARREK